MTLLSGILKRAPVALSLESLAVVRDTFSTEKLTRSNTMANLNLPTPIGKREQAKRFFGAAFSRRQAQPAPAVETSLQPPPHREHLPASLVARFDALGAPPPATQSAKPARPSASFLPNRAQKQRLFTIHEGSEENEHD